MASPAQIANDMQARSKFWDGRNRRLSAACRDAAHVIRAYLFGPHPDGRTVQGLLTRLFAIDGEFFGLGGADTKYALQRARDAIIELRKQVRNGAQ